ncbi:MAG: glycosyltransferase family 4 protein [Lachnospiraceae bacterium]
MRKRYCIFAAYYLPHLGGIERYVYNLATKLVERGEHVTIVTSQVSGLPLCEMKEGIEIYRLPSYDLLGGRFPIAKWNDDTRKIFHVLSQKHFDLVIINARFYVLSILAALFARKTKSKCIVLEHGSGHLTVHNRFFDFLGERYEHFHTWILKRICKNYYGTCKACNEWLEHFHIKSKGIIYNAINIQEVEAAKQEKKFYREKYNIPSDAVVITFTGRLIGEKGILNLLQAVEQNNKRYVEKVYLFIAGMGDLEAEIKEHQSEYIIPLGQIEHKEVFKLLSESDIYCLPSVSEAFCGGVLEAVACKCYVITTSRGGSKELISSKAFGTIIDKNDSATVLEALRWCVCNTEMCEKAIKKAYDKLINNYTWDIIVEDVQKLVK